MELKICTNDIEWDNFCLSSTEGSPFMMSWFINCNKRKFVRYFLIEDSKILAASLFYLNEIGKIIDKPKGNSVYHSFCYSEEFSLKNNLRSQSKRLKIMEDLIINLLKIYNFNIYFSFHPKIVDLRSLTWINQNNKKKKCNVSLRYTAIKNLEKIKDINDLLLDIRVVRRQEYNKSLKKNFIISGHVSLSEFLDIYNKTFFKHHIVIDEDQINFLKNFYKSLNDRNSFVIALRDKENKLASLVVCIIDNYTAYGLFALNNPTYKDLGAGSRCAIEAILYAKKIGKKFYDFIGANSPNRGDFKISFRSELNPYYEAEIINLS